MAETRRNLLVGLFTIAGLAALALLMAMFGEAPEWIGGAEWPLKIHVAELRGAPEGTAVNLNGIQIGRVGSLEFDNPDRPDQGVYVVALIKEKYNVPSGAKAIIYEPVLGVGRGHIEIIVPPESGGPLLPRENASVRGQMGSMIHEIVPTTMMGSIEKTVIQIGSFAEALTPVADDLHDLLMKTPVGRVDDPAEARRLTANLSTVVQRLDESIKHFNEVIGDPAAQGALRESLENIRRITEDGRIAAADIRETTTNLRDSGQRIVSKFERGIDDASANVDEFSRKAAPILDNLAKATSNLNRVSALLAEGQGTAGKLLRDDRLYEKLVFFIDRLTEVVTTIGRIAAKSERQGYIDVAENKRVPGAKIPAKVHLYDPNAASGLPDN